jgi:hypothetical protein
MCLAEMAGVDLGDQGRPATGSQLEFAIRAYGRESTHDEMPQRCSFWAEPSPSEGFWFCWFDRRRRVLVGAAMLTACLLLYFVSGLLWLLPPLKGVQSGPTYLLGCHPSLPSLTRRPRLPSIRSH